MCVYSMVMDHYQPLIPQIVGEPWPTAPVTPADFKLQIEPKLDLEALRKLINEFNEAVAAAKKVDVLTKQPDCEDPEKAKLVERVAELERRLAALEKRP